MSEEMGEFKPFTVKIPDTMRYWEDDTTGVIVKRGQEVSISNPRFFRSAELKFALMRNRLIMTQGECTFSFKGQMVHMEPGTNKNLITVMSGPEKGVVIGEKKIEKVHENYDTDKDVSAEAVLGTEEEIKAHEEYVEKEKKPSKKRSKKK